MEHCAVSKTPNLQRQQAQLVLISETQRLIWHSDPIIAHMYSRPYWSGSTTQSLHTCTVDHIGLAVRPNHCTQKMLPPAIIAAQPIVMAWFYAGSACYVQTIHCYKLPQLIDRLLLLLVIKSLRPFTSSRSLIKTHLVPGLRTATTCGKSFPGFLCGTSRVRVRGAIRTGDEPN